MRAPLSLLVAAVAALAGCAKAASSSPGGQQDSGPPPIDSPTDPGTDGSTPPPHDGGPPPIDAFVFKDAPPPDAPLPVTLTQVSSNAIASSSLACGESESTNDYRTDENEWYRVFDLPSMGITDTLYVTSVNFAIQEANGSPPVQVRVGTYDETVGVTIDTGTTDWGGGGVTAINSATVTIPNISTTNSTMLSAPVQATIPAGSQLIVEIYAADDTSKTDTYFFLGASTGTETTPGFFRAPGCDADVASTPAELGQPVTPFIITVTGTH